LRAHGGFVRYCRLLHGGWHCPLMTSAGTSLPKKLPTWSLGSGVALWPGLARLWLRGEVRGLLTAVAFSTVLNFALITTFIWPQLVSRQLPPWAVPAMAWIVVVWFWVAGLRAGGALAAAVARANTPGDEESLTQFRQAQLEYLKGHWVEAESQLRRLLARTPGDVEAWLLLASVQRRTERPDEARRSLKALVELSGSAIWAEEVQRELAKIQQLERELRNKTKGPLSQAA
jgi:hypothetical protein